MRQGGEGDKMEKQIELKGGGKDGAQYTLQSTIGFHHATFVIPW